MKNIRKIFLGSVVLAGMLFTSCTYTNINNGLSEIRYEKDEEYVVGNQTYEADLKEVCINWVNGDIYLEYTEETTVILTEVSETSDEISDDIKLHTYLDGDKLFVQPSSCGSYKFDFEKNLTIKIPTNTNLDKLYVNSISGKLVSNVEIKDNDIHSISSDAYFAINNFDKLNFNTISGELKLFVKSDILVNASISTVSGIMHNNISTVDIIHIVKMNSVSSSCFINHVEKTYITTGIE